MKVDISVILYNANSWVHPKPTKSRTGGPGEDCALLTSTPSELEKILFPGNKLASLVLGGFLLKGRIHPCPLNLSPSSPNKRDYKEPSA